MPCRRSARRHCRAPRHGDPEVEGHPLLGVMLGLIAAVAPFVLGE
jgi:hypothetical protein